MRVALPLLLGLCFSCAPPPEAPPPKAPPAAKPKPRPSMAIQSSVGALDQAAVDRSFRKLFGAVETCLTEGDIRVKGIGGSFTVALRIKADGSARSAYLSSSTLGDRDSERCILDAALAKRWPKPVGGEGEASHTFEVEGTQEVHEWGPKVLRPVMGEIRKQLYKCTKEVGGSFTTTLYVKRNGRVATAGVAPPNAEGEAQADCVADVLRTFRFGPQRRPITKVTFSVP